jgi:hypothetical protein
MDSSIITVLAIILLILIVLNHVTIISPTISTNASCSQTSFGCCPNGVDSKINYYGTNCPGYRPGPGYYPSSYVPPPQPVPAPKQIGGCAGTRYGCCPNNNTPKINPQGSNCVLK